MAEAFTEGCWLLVDAAGPESMAGILREGELVGLQWTHGDVLEWLPAAVEIVLREAGASTANLAGCIYAQGPGSTLGLRVAALFLRSLMAMPAHAHWKCLTYNNLEVALAGRIGRPDRVASAGAAPWRRDRVHVVRLKDTRRPLAFEHGYCAPDDPVLAEADRWLLGRRPHGAAAGTILEWQPYPLESLAGLLTRYPELLSPVEGPGPYTADEPEFARWTPQRHNAS